MTTTYKIPLNATAGTEGKPESWEPQRHVDYQLYPPSATSHGKGWAVTIGGEYVKVAPFECRSDAEAYAKQECIKKNKLATPPSDQPHKRQESAHAPRTGREIGQRDK